MKRLRIRTAFLFAFVALWILYIELFILHPSYLLPIYMEPHPLSLLQKIMLLAADNVFVITMSVIIYSVWVLISSLRQKFRKEKTSP